MKRYIAMVLSVVLVLCLTACAAKHYDESNIDQLYDSEWIVGKSRQQIEAKYGDFNREYIADNGEDLGAYYVNYENGGFDPSYIHDTYFVVFNDEDIAVAAYFRETSVGG